MNTKDKTPLTMSEANGARAEFVERGMMVNVVNTVPGMDRGALMLRWSINGALISIETRGKLAFHRMINETKKARG